MDDLTLCLITKGRNEYLEPLLESFDAIVGLPNIKFVIILNGTSDEITQRFEYWARNHGDKVRISHFKNNDARLSTFLPIIHAINTSWVCFPSDDDIINVEFFRNWQQFISKFSNYDAIATNLDLIDGKGNFRGIRKTPSYDLTLAVEERVAKAISECPFLWPGLIIRKDRVPLLIPPTRYVSDWWIGLFLILGSRIALSEHSFTRYRVHSQQESSVSSLSRKNQEALIHLETLFQMNIFEEWINGLEIGQVVFFLESLVKYPPLYGDKKFSSELVSIITKSVCQFRTEIEIQSKAYLVNAFFHGVIVDESQTLYLQSSSTEWNQETTTFNVRFVFDPSTCEVVRRAQDLVQISSTNYPELSVGCAHSPKNVNDVSLDCTAKQSTLQILDMLSQVATIHFEKLGFFEGSVSQFEYSLILRLRNIKKIVPASINRRLYRIFRV